MAAESVEHPALARASSGVALGEGPLTDSQRLGVVLQAAALLAHLDLAGWRLEGDLQAARVDGDGVLGGLRAAPGAGARSCQEELRSLLLALFGSQQRVAGRGSARRAARVLLSRWSDELLDLDANREVASILEVAPFLWEPRYGKLRRALGAVHSRPEGEVLWVCGPDAARRRLVGEAGTFSDLRRLLEGPRAQELWEGPLETGDPRRLAVAGKWRRAVRVWRRQPPQDRESRVLHARCLFALGRFQSALEEVADLRSPRTRVLAAWCAFYLGRNDAAHRRVRRLERQSLTPEETVETARLAVRLLANAGDLSGSHQWAERALEITAEGAVADRARLVAAEAAWDARSFDRMSELLSAAEGLREDPEWGWRWHQVCGLRALGRGRGTEASESFAAALRNRRRLTVPDAAALWNDLTVARVQRGDLAGAERAVAHAARLLARCEGPRRHTLALRNLAELRLRRGRLLGVRPILERSLAQNRLDRNVRALAKDAALWARWELVHGRPLAALTSCRRAREELAAESGEWEEPELVLLEARALGWLERGEEARNRLAGLDPEVLVELEPEERPALFAHAGDLEAALESAGPPPLRALWQAALTGEAPAFDDWSALDGLEPYRAARLVWDWELLSPGFTPPPRLRQAIATLRRVGAESLAERLEGRVGGAWEALGAYLRGSSTAPEALQRLFAGAGYGQVRLTSVTGEREEVLVAGPGGSEEVVVSRPGGYLVLSAPAVDGALKCLVQVVRRHLPASAEPSRPPPARVSGMVGESEELLRELDRLRRLAGGDMPVLILGESGTGKELAAGLTHRLSRRSEGPFLPLNCAAVSESLILSELFGHVRGAFTGADRDRRGIFETARGGTVFLDEVGDLPLPAQGMLLRVLQEKVIRRLGESLPRQVDVRVVAATHRDLKAMVAEGTFRQDLYYRLKVATVRLPSLRDRKSDILLLAEHFLRQYEAGRSLRLSAASMSRLLVHRWPGNVRELANVIEVGAALTESGVVEPEHLQIDADPESAVNGSEAGYHEKVRAYRARLVEEALEASGGNRSEAARSLGLSRQALSYLVRELRIVPES